MDEVGNYNDMDRQEIIDLGFAKDIQITSPDDTTKPEVNSLTISR